MILPLLLLVGQVATSTSGMKLTTTLEKALHWELTNERTARRVAERELQGARLELAARGRRVAALETLTASIAQGCAPRIAPADQPLMSPTGALICGGIGLGSAILGGVLGRESCGPIVIRGP